MGLKVASVAAGSNHTLLITDSGLLYGKGVTLLHFSSHPMPFLSLKFRETTQRIPQKVLTSMIPGAHTHSLFDVSAFIGICFGVLGDFSGKNDSC